MNNLINENQQLLGASSGNYAIHTLKDTKSH